jgi:hypothetical protein
VEVAPVGAASARVAAPGERLEPVEPRRAGTAGAGVEVLSAPAAAAPVGTAGLGVPARAAPRVAESAVAASAEEPAGLADRAATAEPSEPAAAQVDLQAVPMAISAGQTRRVLDARRARAAAPHAAPRVSGATPAPRRRSAGAPLVTRVRVARCARPLSED